MENECSEATYAVAPMPDVWVNSYSGLRNCLLKETLGEKSIVVFHGAPEIVDTATVFSARKDAVIARQAQKMREMQAILKELLSLQAEAEKPE